MVNGQITPNRVTDPALIVALNTVPRELYVPQNAQGVAYIDEEIPLGNGRWLLEPMVLARMMQNAEITPRDVVLDVGCACGYSTALLAKLANTVVALESDAGLFEQASKTLAAQATDTVTLVNCPMADGYQFRVPYDVILVNGAVSEVPTALFSQLAEGGRLVAVVAYNHDIVRLGQVRLYRKVGNSVSSVALFETAAAILPGFEFKPRFVF